MHWIPLNVNITARISLVLGCFTTVSSWLKKMHQMLREIAALYVAGSCCEGGAREACPVLCCSWLTPEWLGAICKGDQCCHGVTAATATQTPTRMRWGEIWPLTSYHRIEFYCEFVASVTVKCFFYPRLRPICIGKVDREHMNLNRYNAISHSVMQS